MNKDRAPDSDYLHINQSSTTNSCVIPGKLLKFPEP